MQQTYSPLYYPIFPKKASRQKYSIYFSCPKLHLTAGHQFFNLLPFIIIIDLAYSPTMQLGPFFTRPAHPHPGLKVQPKQEFFATKRHPKRMKVSQCFSEPIEMLSGQLPPQDIDLSFDMKDVLLKSELESTFGQQRVLSFQLPRPRRKNYGFSKIKKENLRQCQSESDGQIPHGKNLVTLNPCKNDRKIANQQTEHFLNHKIADQRKTQPLTIEDFTILAKIGEGTYSEVFKAVEKRSGFICALKVLSKERMKEMKVVDNVIHEIKINSFLDHSNIASLYSCFHDELYIYLICEYATDRNLLQTLTQPRIKLKKGMMSESVAKIMGQLTTAVKFLHNHNVIHRDIKPQNVLVTLFNTVKLCDFGWAVYNPNKEMRETLCGTPLYLAPELVSQDYYNESVDIWAIGVLTYELMTEQNPFKILQFSDLKKIVQDQVRFDCIRNRTAVDFMRRALEKDPQQRTSIYELSSHPFVSQSHPQYNMHI